MSVIYQLVGALNDDYPEDRSVDLLSVLNGGGAGVFEGTSFTVTDPSIPLSGTWQVDATLEGYEFVSSPALASGSAMHFKGVGDLGVWDNSGDPGTDEPTAADTPLALFSLWTAGGYGLGTLGFIGGESRIRISNDIPGGAFRFQAYSTAGHYDSFIDYTPDAALELGYGVNKVARTAAAASGGLQANNTLSGVGFERVLTESDASITSTTAALAAVGNAINTSARKEAGFMVFNTTTNMPVWAVGNADADVWVDATGSTAHTPA